jgi:hypothetical protein
MFFYTTMTNLRMPRDQPASLTGRAMFRRPKTSEPHVFDSFDHINQNREQLNLAALQLPLTYGCSMGIRAGITRKISMWINDFSGSLASSKIRLTAETFPLFGLILLNR